MRREKIVIFIFSMMISSGILGQVILKQRNLSGETVKIEKPEINKEGWMSGSLQAELEAYISENLKIRNYLIPIKNEITYHLLNSSPNSSIVIGKNKELYEEAYIGFETQIYNAMSRDEVLHLSDKLAAMDKVLSDKGKKLFVFITPSKASVYPENIPDKYLAIAPKVRTESSYHLFIEALREKKISFYDSIPDIKALKETSDFRVFPRSGTHWSNVAAALCAQLLGDSMEEQLGIDLPEINVTYSPCEQPVAPDADLYCLLNLIKKSDEQFYEPKISIVEPGG